MLQFTLERILEWLSVEKTLYSKKVAREGKELTDKSVEELDENLRKQWPRKAISPASCAASSPARERAKSTAAAPLPPSRINVAAAAALQHEHCQDHQHHAKQDPDNDRDQRPSLHFRIRLVLARV